MTSDGRLSAWIRSALFDNFSLKLISLLCAIGFFVFIHGAERAQRVFTVPVTVVTPPDSLNRQLLKAPPNEIAVTLSGPRTQIDQLASRDLGTIQLNLETGTETSITLQQNMLDVPPGVTVEQILPSRIELKWDDIIEKKLPVQVGRVENPAPGFTLEGGVLVRPDSVMVRGPRATLDLMQFVSAGNYDVSGMEEGRQERTFELVPPVDNVTYDVESVVAWVEVVPVEESATFGPFKVEVVGNTRATCKPGTVVVVARGTPEAIAALREQKGESIVPRVELPKDVDLSKPSSAMVEVVVDAAGVNLRVEPRQVLVKW